MKKSYIDLHCHPSLKPFGKSFKRINTTRINSSNTSDENSIWCIQRPKLFRKILNVFLRLTKWRQSDFSSVLNGETKVILVSLYPMEKGMVVHENSNNVQLAGRLLRNLASGVSMRRIRHLQKMKDYFEDLESEYHFYKQLHNTEVTINGVTKKYQLVKSVAEIDYTAENILYVILTIEGAHVFNCGLKLAGKPNADEEEVLKNLKKVKDWDFRPFFIGISHHFDNELFGFAESFSGIVSALICQNPDDNQGITELGEKVILELLKNDNGKRILIDLKHMNPKSRYDYYALLEKNYPDENIPIIVSHGALNGKLHYITHNNVWKPGFNPATINFYFDEIQRIESSKGIFGIQLDERRIFDSKTKGEIFRDAKKNMNKFGRPLIRKNTYFIWRQIEHIAIYLDVLNRNAWNIQALGTDFDGIIDPLNGLWTVKELDLLADYLVPHAQDFLISERGQKLKQHNQLDAETIIEKFLFENAKLFLETHF